MRRDPVFWLSATVLGNVNGLQIPRERLDVG